jgi:hypothetical protein
MQNSMGQKHHSVKRRVNFLSLPDGKVPAETTDGLCFRCLLSVCASIQNQDGHGKELL